MAGIKGNFTFIIMALLLSSVMAGAWQGRATAFTQGVTRENSSHAQEQAPTPIPIETQPAQGTPTPVGRVLPPVGGNAGLLIGASVLVLIIIGGVILSGRWRAKH